LTIKGHTKLERVVSTYIFDLLGYRVDT
jgi:hypothetical protein